MGTMTQPGTFRLTRYFTITSFIAFLVVALALTYFSRQQMSFSQQIQQQQAALVTQEQEVFAKQQDELARKDLLGIEQNSHVTLSKLFANVLWEKDFAPFVQQAQAIDLAPCHALPDGVDKDDPMCNFHW